MEDFRKVSVFKLYNLLKNLSIGLLALVVGMALSRLLPFYLSPIITLLAAAFLYQYISVARRTDKSMCMIVPYAVFLCLIAYTFFAIIVNILFAWKIVDVPKEFIFFNDPYIPSLVMMPISFLVVLWMTLSQKHLSFCINCRLSQGNPLAQGRTGALITYESGFQLKNLLVLFGIVTAIVWTYYLVFYININSNARDWYMFTWLVVILFLLDEFYFVFRYYNLYLDLKESDAIAQLPQSGAAEEKTYIRVYVICGNDIFVDIHAHDPSEPYHDVIDTPFFFSREAKDVPASRVLDYIQERTGQRDGELRFFFGREYHDAVNHRIMRYFYFLDAPKDELPELPAQGQWMDFKQITRIYSMSPAKLSRIAIADLNRLATIIITEKIYDAKGNRKSRIKNYRPSFNLQDVRKSMLDFQDDKWMRVALFNSDVRFFHLRSWLRRLSGRNRFHV